LPQPFTILGELELRRIEFPASINSGVHGAMPGEYETTVCRGRAQRNPRLAEPAGGGVSPGRLAFSHMVWARKIGRQFAANSLAERRGLAAAR
jgi:hypothetical protein